MLRSGQMILGTALLKFYFGKDWNPTKSRVDTLKQYQKILQYFQDVPKASFSIHNIAIEGVSLGKKVGEWFGPATVSVVLQRLVDKNMGDEVKLYTPDGCTIYKDQVVKLCTNNSSEHKWKPVIILVPVRLGISSFHNLYLGALQSIFSIPQSLGIIGGRPNASLYFVASQGQNLYYLDPHQTQPFVDMENGNFSTDSFSCNYLNKVDIASIDPSMALGFYCYDASDFDKLCNSITKVIANKDILGVEEKVPEGSHSIDFTKDDFDMDEDLL